MKQFFALAGFDSQAGQFSHGVLDIRGRVHGQGQTRSAASQRRFGGVRRRQGGRNHAHALLALFHLGVNHVRAKLPVQQVRRKARHGQEEQHRNDRNEDIRRDQPVAQAPEEMVARPHPSAYQPVNRGANRQEEQKAGLRELLVVLPQSQKGCIEKENRESNPIDRTHPRPNGATPGCEC